MRPQYDIAAQWLGDQSCVSEGSIALLSQRVNEHGKHLKSNNPAAAAM